MLVAVLDAGAEEVNDLGETFEVVSRGHRPGRRPHRAAGRRHRLRLGRGRRSCPASQVELDEDGARKMFRLIDALEDCDDVQNVYANFDVSDEVLAGARRSRPDAAVRPERSVRGLDVEAPPVDGVPRRHVARRRAR